LRRYAIEKARFYFYSIGIEYSQQLKNFFKRINTLYEGIIESKNIEQHIKRVSKDYYEKYYL